MRNTMLRWIKSQHKEGDYFWVIRDSQHGGDDWFGDILEISEIDNNCLDQREADNLFGFANNHQKLNNEIDKVVVDLNHPSDRDLLLYVLAYTITNRRDRAEINEKGFSLKRSIDYGEGKLYSLNRLEDDWFSEEISYRIDEDEDENERPYKDYYLDWCRREGKDLDKDYDYHYDWFEEAFYNDNKKHQDYKIQEEIYNKVAVLADELWADNTIYTEAVSSDEAILGISFGDNNKIGDLVQFDYELWVLTDKITEDCCDTWEAISTSMEKREFYLRPAGFDFDINFGDKIYFWCDN